MRALEALALGPISSRWAVIMGDLRGIVRNAAVSLEIWSKTRGSVCGVR